VGTIDTRASDTMKWAIGCYDDRTIVLESSDIGTYAWRHDGDRWNELPMSMAMCERARDLFRVK
jgi:hypothetical protein